MSSSPTPPDVAEQPAAEPDPVPSFDPFDLLTAAIKDARAHLAQMAPQTPVEALAHDRAMTALDKLQRHLERTTDPHERPSAAAVALAINLSGHPSPRHALDDLVVRPLLIVASSASSTRAVTSWLDGWLHQANEAVLADIEADRIQHRGLIS